MRLFPGSLTSREYCLDYVSGTDHSKAVDAPFSECELYVAQGQGWPLTRMWTVEEGAGIPSDQVRPGCEKYILRDGMRCVLVRPEVKAAVEFFIPQRVVSSGK